MSETSEHLEKLISGLGGRGLFQNSVHLMAVFACYTSLAFNHVVMAFHGSPLAHICKAGAARPDQGVNSTSWTEVNGTHVTNVTHSQCHSTATYSDGQQEVIECTSGQWEYFPKYGERNLIREFDLVCSDEYLTSLATTIYFTGVMVGGLVFGDLADRFGRLPIALFTLYASIVAGLVSAFSVNVTMFVCLRFIVGVLVQGVQMAFYTLIIEMFPPKDRPYAGIISDSAFPVVVILMTGLAYAMPYWRHLQVAVSLIPLVSVFYVWYLPESLRWLVIKGKTKRAEQLLRRICKINKIPYPAETWNRLEKSAGVQGEVQQQYHVTHLFRTWSLMKVTVISSYVWIVVAVCYYGLTFKVTSLPGSYYTNFFISGVVEILSYIVTLYCVNRFGRKKPMFGCLMGAAVLCLASGLVDTFTTGLGHLVTSLAIAGKCFAGGLFATFFVYITEVYPTVVRNIGLGFGLFWARLGGVLAPQCNQWSKVLLGVDAIYVFGVLSLVGAGVILLLPETHGRRLPDTIDSEVTSMEKLRPDEEDGEDTPTEDLL